MRILPIFLMIFFLQAKSTAYAIDFSISSPQLYGQEIEVNASISGLSSVNYLQGTLKMQDKKYYFGSTLNHLGDWFSYISSPSPDYIKSTFYLVEPIEGSWSGKLKLKYDSTEEHYYGPGTYELKLRRFTGNSSTSAGDSNTLTLNLTSSTPTPEPTSTPEPQAEENNPSPTNNVSTISSTSTPSPSATKKPTPSPIDDGEVKGTSSTADINLDSFTLPPSPEMSMSEEASQSSLDPPKIAGMLILASGLLMLSGSGVYFYKQRQTSHSD